MDSVLVGNNMSTLNDRPFATYKKVILGQMSLTVWDRVLSKPVEIILHGNPNKNDQDCVVQVWSKQEDDFLKRVNRNHFSRGRIIPFTVDESQQPEHGIEQASDEELTKILSYKHLKFLAEINKIQSIAVLFRLQGLAESLEKSSGYTNALVQRISELQTEEYTVRPAPAEEE